MKKTRFIRLSMTALLIIFLSGCTWNHKDEPKKFGSSVRAMVKSQIYDRSTIKNPPMDVIKGMDSKKAISDLQQIYRKTDVSKQQIKTAAPTGGE